MSVKVTEEVELKHIQKLLNQAVSSMKCLEEDRRAVEIKIGQQKSIIESLKAKIAAFDRPDKLVISEHAILRFLERVYKMDIEAWKKEIVPQSTLETVLAFKGNGLFTVGDTHKIVVRNGIVLTVK